MKNKTRLLLCATLTFSLSVAALMGYAHPADPTEFLQQSTRDVIAPYTHMVVKGKAVSNTLRYDNRCGGEFIIFLDNVIYEEVGPYEWGDIIYNGGVGDFDEILIEGDGNVYYFELYSDIGNSFGTGMNFSEDTLSPAGYIEVLMFDN